MPCPICGKAVSIDDPSLPFCSDRCRLTDLGNWASEKYVIPGATQETPDDGEAEKDEA
jgi:hypothetical protein